jgi:hypothetical protein
VYQAEEHAQQSIPDPFIKHRDVRTTDPLFLLECHEILNEKYLHLRYYRASSGHTNPLMKGLPQSYSWYEYLFNRLIAPRRDTTETDSIKKILDSIIVDVKPTIQSYITLQHELRAFMKGKDLCKSIDRSVTCTTWQVLFAYQQNSKTLEQKKKKEIEANKDHEIEVFNKLECIIELVLLLYDYKRFAFQDTMTQKEFDEKKRSATITNAFRQKGIENPSDFQRGIRVVDLNLSRFSTDSSSDASRFLQLHGIKSFDGDDTPCNAIYDKDTKIIIDIDDSRKSLEDGIQHQLENEKERCSQTRHFAERLISILLKYDDYSLNKGGKDLSKYGRTLKKMIRKKISLKKK